MEGEEREEWEEREERERRERLCNGDVITSPVPR